MRSFQFRLSRVLRVKEILEEKAQLEWVEKGKLLRLAEVQLGELEEDRRALLAFGYEQTDVTLRQALYHYLPAVEDRILKQKQAVVEAREALEQARQNWLAKRQEREALAHLKEKQFQEYLLEQNREEQKWMDELGTRKLEEER